MSRESPTYPSLGEIIHFRNQQGGIEACLNKAFAVESAVRRGLIGPLEIGESDEQRATRLAQPTACGLSVSTTSLVAPPPAALPRPPAAFPALDEVGKSKS